MEWQETVYSSCLLKLICDRNAKRGEQWHQAHSIVSAYWLTSLEAGGVRSVDCPRGEPVLSGMLTDTTTLLQDIFGGGRESTYLIWFDVEACTWVLSHVVGWWRVPNCLAKLGLYCPFTWAMESEKWCFWLVCVECSQESKECGRVVGHMHHRATSQIVGPAKAFIALFSILGWWRAQI